MYDAFGFNTEEAEEQGFAWYNSLEDTSDEWEKVFLEHQKRMAKDV